MPKRSSPESCCSEALCIYWGDETAVKEDGNWVRGYVPAGTTLAMPARWRKLPMISAISPSESAFRIVEDSNQCGSVPRVRVRAHRWGAQRKMFLMVDNLRVHHAKRVSIARRTAPMPASSQ